MWRKLTSGTVACAAVFTLGCAPEEIEKQVEAERPLLDPGGVDDAMKIASVLLEGELRSIDGSGNNVTDPTRGAAGVALLRTMPADYADGVSAPAGSHRLGARAVSNAVHAQSESMPNPMNASDMLWQWGQLIDHDIDLTEAAEPREEMSIQVPAGDPQFDPAGSGDQQMRFARSAYIDCGAQCVREQVNGISAYIDASFVYGSDDTRARALRALDGTGMLKTSDGDLLPFNVEGLPNAALPGMDPASLFLAGDVRANEQVGLTAMHTLFVREHNRIAAHLREQHPELSGDDIYELARAIVAAEVQVITYEEFLPVLIGADALPAYAGYDPAIDAGIANEFSTAGYRLGHSLLSSTLLRLGPGGEPIAEGHLSLRNAFFAPNRITGEGGIEPILRGLLHQRAENLDVFVVDDVRNFLFGPPGAGGFDLASLNIQRGRDHGLPGYNEARVAFGLEPAEAFSDVSSSPAIQARLAEAYASVDDIDLWTGALAEDQLPGALVGELMRAIVADQFLRLRDGDRFWYQSYLPPELVAYVESVRLSDVIRLNTAIDTEIGNDAFHVTAGCLDHSFERDDAVAIPDDDTAGASASIAVDGAGAIAELRVSVEITHSWRGDLRVILVAPSGDEVVLHDRQGGSADDLSLVAVDVAAFDGQPAAGSWTLRVADLARLDTGTLESWSITVLGDCDAEPPPCEPAHPVCEQGDGLDPTCDACVASVCEADAFCCENRWDSLCVDQAEALCGVTCREPPVCHDPCEEGDALDASCGECAASICDADPFCCSTAWDDLCVGEVDSICGQSCP